LNTESASSTAPVDSWSRYWRQGVLHSCGCAFPDNYAGVVARFWRARLDGLGSGARVVDIGTGNGAIPLLARDFARERGLDLDIHGVDLADIDPAAAVADGARRYAGIHFHPGTSAADLPFDEASVDLLSGQFALEYMPAAVLGEIARVLRDGASLAVVLHARDSVVMATTAEQLDLFRTLSDSDFFARVEAVACRLAAASTPAARQALAADAAAEAARAALNAAAARLSEAIRAARTPDVLQLALGYASEALAQAAQRGEAATRAYLRDASERLQDERERLLDLDRAALDEAALAGLADQLCAVGFDRPELGSLDHESGRKLGWTLIARRRRDGG
jgi:SAM-dependent methyltransferase